MLGSPNKTTSRLYQGFQCAFSIFHFTHYSSKNNLFDWVTQSVPPSSLYSIDKQASHSLDAWMSKSQAEGDNRSFQTGGARIGSFRLDTDIRSMQMGHPRQNCVEIMCRACEVYRICGAVCVYVSVRARMQRWMQGGWPVRMLLRCRRRVWGVGSMGVGWWGWRLGNSQPSGPRGACCARGSPECSGIWWVVMSLQFWCKILPSRSWNLKFDSLIAGHDGWL